LSDNGERTIFREMGYSRAEFERVLPAAMRDWLVTGGPDVWRISTLDGGGIAIIQIEAMAERKIGSLQLPVLAVTIELIAASSDLADEFVRRFERGFHRGGG